MKRFTSEMFAKYNTTLYAVTATRRLAKADMGLTLVAPKTSAFTLSFIARHSETKSENIYRLP